MKTITLTRFVLALLASFAFVFAGCEQTNDTGDTLEEAGEETGEAAEEGAEEVEDAAQ